MCFKVFLRQKPFWICIFLIPMLLAAVCVLTISASMSAYELLYVESRFSWYICAAITLTAYLCLSHSHICNVDETLSSCKKTGFYQIYGMWVFTGVSVIFHLIGIFCVIFACFRNDGTAYFFTVLPKAYFYNIFFPQIICLFLATILAYRDSPILSPVLLILFMILTSPAMELLCWPRKPSLPIDWIYNKIQWLFSIFYQYSNWTPNTLGGLQTESVRGALLGFWILGLGALMIRIFVKVKQRYAKYVCTMFFALGSFACLVYSFLPSSLYRLDGKWNGSGEDSLLYSESSYIRSEDIQTSFSIQTCDLSVKIRRELSVNATLYLQADDAIDEFVFTLYHGYKVEDLDSPETELTWSVQGDYVTVKTDEAVSELTVNISYRGKHNIYFSGTEGAILPGWLPWYPMAGERQIYLNYERIASGYNTYNRINEDSSQGADIKLTVDAPWTYITNLEKSEEGIYTAKGCDSITLIGGYTNTTQDEIVRNYLPLELTADTYLEDSVYGKNSASENFVSEISLDYQTILQAISEYGLDTSLIDNKKIFLASRDLCRTTFNNDVSIFSDYILTWSGGLTMENISMSLILEHCPESELAQLVCGLGGLCESPSQTLEYWQMALYVFGVGNDYPLAVQFSELLSAADAVGEGELLICRVAQFLFSENVAENEMDFLKEVEEFYASST